MTRPQLIHRRCTAESFDGNFCDEISVDGMPFPICARHAILVYRHLQDLVEMANATPEARAAAALRMLEGDRAEQARREASPSWCVYYLRIGDVIKIGTTSNLAQRLANYPPMAELLARERGGPELEVQRHTQFAGLLRHGKEWFAADAKLLDFIASIAAR